MCLDVVAEGGELCVSKGRIWTEKLVRRLNEGPQRFKHAAARRGVGCERKSKAIQSLAQKRHRAGFGACTNMSKLHRFVWRPIDGRREPGRTRLS